MTLINYSPILLPLHYYYYYYYCFWALAHSVGIKASITPSVGLSLLFFSCLSYQLCLNLSRFKLFFFKPRCRPDSRPPTALPSTAVKHLLRAETQQTEWSR